jgi:transposase InsO family protein
MKVLQSDDTDMVKSKSMSAWLLNRGIQLRLSAPYVHSQNGMVERDMGYVLDTARTMMSVYTTPPSFWSYAIEQAVYTINRTHFLSNFTMTPYELVYGVKT